VFSLLRLLWRLRAQGNAFAGSGSHLALAVAPFYQGWACSTPSSYLCFPKDKRRASDVAHCCEKPAATLRPAHFCNTDCCVPVVCQHLDSSCFQVTVCVCMCVCEFGIKKLNAGSLKQNACEAGAVPLDEGLSACHPFQLQPAPAHHCWSHVADSALAWRWC
jgi:hypothetical protein